MLLSLATPDVYCSIVRCCVQAHIEGWKREDSSLEDEMHKELQRSQKGEIPTLHSPQDGDSTATDTSQRATSSGAGGGAGPRAESGASASASASASCRVSASIGSGVGIGSQTGADLAKEGPGEDATRETIEGSKGEPQQVHTLQQVGEQPGGQQHELQASLEGPKIPQVTSVTLPHTKPSPGNPTPSRDPGAHSQQTPALQQGPKREGMLSPSTSRSGEETDKFPSAASAQETDTSSSAAWHSSTASPGYSDVHARARGPGHYSDAAGGGGASQYSDTGGRGMYPFLPSLQHKGAPAGLFPRSAQQQQHLLLQQQQQLQLRARSSTPGRQGRTGIPMGPNTLRGSTQGTEWFPHTVTF